ncbi:hypothetical protein [Ottowia sp. VDI28]|uniref:hypothetical protein n=1 Tax=Ottowia sp. VDI28 TaxID=3133968 RepID=UPI003C2C4848
MRQRRHHNRPGPQVLPKFWRPKLSAGQVLDARIIHNDLLDRLTTGKATSGDLWDWMETGFTYTQMMRMLAEDGMEFTDEAMHALAAQLESYEEICARLRRTGRVGLSGPEIRIAQDAAAVMDELVGLDRHGIAERAARWSIEQMSKIRRAAG